ncbi:MAG: hypothetical protein IPM79_28815 [Polyangiaceae bacterium]|jgi:hypothetical protein|nr:hypothetical protein [Polyangiaceae bacterium]
MTQDVLVWVTVAGALAYLARVFVLPQLGADKRPDVPVGNLVRRARKRS